MQPTTQAPRPSSSAARQQRLNVGAMGSVPNASGYANPLLMEISSAWSRILPNDAVQDINHDLTKNGLGHVVWGSKPVFYLEEKAEEGVWKDMTACASLGGVKPGFTLIPSSKNDQLPEDEQFGYLVNLKNTTDVITANKPFFISRFNLNAEWSSEQILHQHVLPFLGTKEYSKDGELTAILLGYGRENSAAHTLSIKGNPAQKSTVAEQNHRLDRWVKERTQELGQAKDFGYSMPAVPTFMKFDTPETRGLLNTYIQESNGIQDGHMALLHRHEDKTDGSLLQDSRLLVSAFLQELFYDPNQ
ncbi:hypothetical protein G3O00_30225 [Burkholderia sp. Ac-20384]|uniref:hypothetical protein n=1 Tax=Burkholderia sp. Ac-20384 TaxID=2703902 RepID=UPI00197E603D|nr:hypothetical protein [Burkholderia sp. Ac-20384]MBN3827869.1 hypothetical protein [Burkholderia sp. Ac-20384]